MPAAELELNFRHMDIIECQQFFEGRRVAFVGNANSIFGKGHGAAIDSYDIVVRFNYGEIKSVRDQGKRTDTLATSDSRIEWDFIREKFSPKFVIWLPSTKDPVKLMHGSDIPLFRTPTHVAKELHPRTSPGLPSSGLIAAYLIKDKFRAESVNLFGFDFFQSRSFYHRIHWRFWRKKRMVHDGRSERGIMESMGVVIH